LIEDDVIAPVEATEVEWKWSVTLQNDAHCFRKGQVTSECGKGAIGIAKAVKENKGVGDGLVRRWGNDGDDHIWREIRSSRETRCHTARRVTTAVIAQEGALWTL
jgi:peptidyl-tRNA hydrolase